jgi:hypothetical protein
MWNKTFFMILLFILCQNSVRSQQLDSAGYHLSRAGHNLNIGIASTLIGSAAVFVSITEGSITPLTFIGGGFIFFGVTKQLTSGGHLRKAGAFMRKRKITLQFQGNRVGLICRL